MRAAMNWSVVISDSPAVTAEHTADVQKLNLRFSNLPSNQTRVKLSARDVITGVDYNVTVCGRADLSGQEACVTKTVRRVGKKVPKIRFPRTVIKTLPSVTLKLRGEFWFLFSVIRVTQTPLTGIDQEEKNNLLFFTIIPLKFSIPVYVT